MVLFLLVLALCEPETKEGSYVNVRITESASSCKLLFFFSDIFAFFFFFGRSEGKLAVVLKSEVARKGKGKTTGKE